MRKSRLGEFEELVLLAVLVLQQDAYGVQIRKQIEKKLEESVSVGSIQSNLKRLAAKGFLTSVFGETTSKRGGKRKRIYSSTPYAHKALHEINAIRESFWSQIQISELKTI
jgi:PadR family transcriptional regulator PadR